jgi:putative membrane protein
MNYRHWSRTLRLYLTGLSMGTADLIPGVSGGTIAFVSGIYEELLHSINLITGQVLKLWLKGQIREGWSLIPFRFLLPLALGMISAIFGLAHALSWLLETYPLYVWGFFFALVMTSTMIVAKRVRVWNASRATLFALSAIGAFFLVGLSPVETPFTLWAIFLSGFIAICAMILPGISGSFILLLLGKYQQVLKAVTESDFLTLGVLGLGCVLGLALFSRFLSWLFKKYHDISVVILAGFMLGSVRKIWPWQLENKPVLPDQFNTETGTVLVFMLIGFIIVFGLDRFRFLKERTQDLENKTLPHDHQSGIKQTNQ